MSFPSAAPVLSAVGAATPVGVLDTLVLSLNTNPYFIGVMMLFLNLGGRFLALDITKSQEAFFQNPWVRRLLLFTVLFMGTRNVLVAFYMTLVIILLIGYLFNENSSLCLFKVNNPGTACDDKGGAQGFTGAGSNGSYSNNNGSVIGAYQMISQVPPGYGMTPEELEILKRLTEKQARLAQEKSQAQGQEPKPDAKLKKLALDTYTLHMGLMDKAEGFLARF